MEEVGGLDACAQPAQQLSLRWLYWMQQSYKMRAVWQQLLAAQAQIRRITFESAPLHSPAQRQSHDDLFSARVARSLADAVDGHLQLARTRHRGCTTRSVQHWITIRNRASAAAGHLQLACARCSGCNDRDGHHSSKPTIGVQAPGVLQESINEQPSPMSVLEAACPRSLWQCADSTTESMPGVLALMPRISSCQGKEGKKWRLSDLGD